MITLRQGRLWTVAVSIALVLATTGCATKNYVRSQVNPVNQKLGALQKKTNDQISYLNNQQKRDVSELNERISTTDSKVNEVAMTAQQAQGTASRAMETADSNSSKIAETAAAVNTLGAGVANALNFEPVEQADVLFGFNKSTLTPAAMATLDQVAQKAQSLPRVIVELAGFTDPVGSKAFNLALSRRRAEAVQRYLVDKKVPIRSIQIVGMGKEYMAPPHLAGTLEPSNPNPTKAEQHQLARRVYIKVYGAGDITGTASRSKE